MTLKTDDVLFVRPSVNNMHEFVAKENSCFFDICLPNYTPMNHSRRITYFKEIMKDQATLYKGGITEVEYDTTPPVMPVDFKIEDLTYRGSFMWALDAKFFLLTNFYQSVAVASIKSWTIS